MYLRSGLRHLLDFCYPRVCGACGGASGDGLEVCPGCIEELTELEGAAACPRCGKPVAEDGAPCPHCFGEGIKPLDGVIRLGIFKDPIRHLVHQIKYHGRWTLAEYLADRLLANEPVKELLAQTDVLVPVPLHPLRQVSRGYNQAEVIARRLGRRCRIKLARPLVRLKHTETQTHLHSRMKRFENLRDAFGLLRPRAVQGRHVVLVDDVLTTGATLHHAALAVAEAEPASLCAIVIAVADPQGRDFEMI